MAPATRTPRHERARLAAARNVLPGLLLAGALGLTAHLAAKLALPYALAVGFEVSLAMLLGLLVVNLGWATPRALPGIRFAVKYVLGAGIILLGLRLNLESIAAIGSEAFLLVLATIGATCGFAVLAGRRLGVQARLAVLIGIGASVCGNSAIAAAAPVVRADEREMSFAVATITIFGTAAVFLFPLIGHALDLDVLAFGLWAGSAVPDTAQTIASSAAYSTVGRDVAAVVKLVRILLLAPLLLLVAWTWSRYEAGASASAKRSARKAVPFFLVGFVLMAVVRSARVVDPALLANFDVLTRACFLVALAGLGLQTRLGHIRVLGPRPFVLGLGTFGVLAAGSLTLILALGLGPTRTSVASPSDPRAWTATPAATNAATVTLTGRVLATGVHGAGALSPVGRFHAGGPMHDKRDFEARTRRGAILDPRRLLVASTSNFGAPRARAAWATGSVLSVATDAPATLAIPPRFAADGGQARALDGAVQVLTAQSPAFVNGLSSPGAGTAALPAVAAPTGISVNNAFGRPWISNAAGASGLESVIDPDGRPLADAPSERAGGVFAGSATDRAPQRLRGSLATPALGNALLGASPDASGRAVFAVATADGALAQVHVEDGVDGLAPPRTLTPVGGGATRIGMAFNWVPDRFLYVTDPGGDAVVQLRLDDDFHVFRVVATRRLSSPLLAEPIDLAPVVPEIANPAFSSNTTLAGGSDLYVANRGTGTIVRLRQDGRIRAVASIAVPGRGRLGAGELNGIAVSPDAGTIWLSVADAIVAISAFGA